MPGRDNVAYIVSSIHELNCFHASSMDESGVVYSVDVVFLLHSRPDNFVESGHRQQGQPIQKLHQGVTTVTPGTRCIEQLSGTVHLRPSNMDCALSGSMCCVHTWHSASIRQCKGRT